MNEPFQQPAQQPDPQAPHAGFCQICGRAVASESARLAGQAFPCGLCNELKLAAPASTGYVHPGPDSTIPGGAPIPPVPPFVAPALGKDIPNPGLAALLGLIPGVGAMYNGQYPKGIVHLLVFAILASLADTNGIFGFLAFVWVCYQAIEAHHTARARRDGTVLPNPFGLNDIGERLGFGKSWPAYTPNPNAAPPAPGADQPQQPPATNWGAPWDTYRYQAPPVPPVPPVPSYPGTPPYTPVPPAYTGGSYAPYGAAPYGPMDPALGYEPPPLAMGSRFPAGAIWLIALGTLFLLNTSGIFRGLNFRLFLPLFFIGLGVWQFVHKMTRSGLGLADDGTSLYKIRVFRAARGSVWLILLGVIFFLADFNILSWGRSWPLFLILAGVMTFLERAVYRDAVPQPFANYPPPPYGTPQPASQPVPEPATAASAPTTIQDREGR